MRAKNHHTPPAYPPPKRPLLKSSSALHYPVDLEQLAYQGWTTLPICDAPSDPLHSVFSELFSASAQFFGLPEEERMKYRVVPQGDSQVSEEGYSRVAGEKCMIALRKAETTPTEFELCAKAELAWRASAELMRDVLVMIEESLGMTPGALVRTTEAQLALPQEGADNVATLMRMFRYDRLPVPVLSGADAEPRVVSEPHKDLGLLTIVVGHSPGLECWDAARDAWISCESRGGLNATILVGQTLAKFTNMRFSAGRHRVFVHPSPSPDPSSKDAAAASLNNINPLSDPSYRFSLVHALRGHLPLHVSYTDFETAVTGPSTPATRFLDASISDIYRAISNAHWNVNISLEVRRRQEKVLLERVEKEAAQRAASAGNLDSVGSKEKSSRSNPRFSRIISLFRHSQAQ